MCVSVAIVGETLANAFVREMLEETGLRIEPAEALPFTATDAIFRAADDAAAAGGAVTYHYGIVQFVCALLDPARHAALRAADDAAAAEWLDVSAFAANTSDNSGGRGVGGRYSSMVPETVRRGVSLVATPHFHRSSFLFP